MVAYCDSQRIVSKITSQNVLGRACNEDVAQMVERSLSMREALGSMPSFSTFLAVVSSNADCANEAVKFC